MKRIVFTSVVAFGLCLVLIQTSFAQIQVGVRAGANWGFASKPDFLSSLTPTLYPSAGPVGALFLDIPLSDRVSFRPEISYVQKGFAVKQGLDLNLGGFTLPLGVRIAYQSQTLEIPLLAKVNLTDAESTVQPYLIVGPAVSFAFDGRIRTRGTSLFTTQPVDIDVDYGNTLSRWDVSAVGGLGLSMNAGRGKFLVEARYTHGFTRQVQLPVININARNRGVAVSVGYSFPIGNY
ncbi:porin family protein [Spirosoma sp. SC4-14]|uniref:porin family protein n=1 Tax=Spirosoma sp. SC4-14 TaxID=3128900 RepID=UPI0030D2F67B